MMIMKIYSVIVDELPKSCYECRLTQWSTDGKRMYCFCVVLDEMVNLVDYPNIRPHNCPLKLESEQDKLKIDVDAAMDAINKPEDPCGFSIEVCESDENRLSDKEK